jgi:signal-transduction protein with cAMP-binding, CBS, and nucleotidyltransferase domain
MIVLIVVLKARDIMTKDFIILDASTDCLSAAKRMAEHHKGFVIVSRQGKPAGIVTEWDFLEKIVAAEVDSRSVKLESVMSDPLVYCDMETPTEEAIQLMVEKGVRRLLVREGENVVGVITSRTVLEIFKRYVDEITALVARFSSTLL